MGSETAPAKVRAVVDKRGGGRETIWYKHIQQFRRSKGVGGVSERTQTRAASGRRQASSDDGRPRSKERLGGRRADDEAGRQDTACMMERGGARDELQGTAYETEQDGIHKETRTSGAENIME